MFTFEKRDEGFFATRDSDGRAVAHVDTQVIGETNDPNLRNQKKVVTPLPQEKWLIHFTGTKLTPSEVLALVNELGTQGDKKEPVEKKE